MTAEKTTPCNCLDDFNERLKEHNTKIDVTFGFPRDGSPAFIRPTILTSKIEPRKRVGPAIAVPTFCPFCGNRYEGYPVIPAAEQEGGAA
jgi:hypothetical protein